MRRRLTLLLPLLLLSAGALTTARCFSPDLPACAYICAATAPRCPDQYECRDDGYCHKRGSTEACPYRMDLSPAPPDLTPPLDLASSPDLTPPPDMPASDGGGG